MAIKIFGKYQGNLRCELTHSPSNSTINTDAPTDNNGKGENFSPTDLIASGLVSCMVTIISIRAKAKNITLGGISYTAVKHMQSSPRKIDKIEVTIEISKEISEENKKYLENEAKNCPVALSINPEIEQIVTFKYG